MNIIQKPLTSGNFASGRSAKVDMIVIHVAQATQQGTFNTFNNPAEEKSSHYCVSNAGEVWQFVDEKNTAWHAGKIVTPTSALVLQRPGVNPNAYSIGIEHEGENLGDTTPGDFTEAQYSATGALVGAIAARWNIPLDRTHIVGHKEIRGDKTCPGAKVSLDRIISIAKGGQVDKTALLKADILAVLAKY